jgi:uncharacterized protein YgiM (DUF1202 family)
LLAKILPSEATFRVMLASPHMSDGIRSPFEFGERELHMRSVRIAAAAGIVATGLALGAAGIATAATPTAATPTASAPAPAQAKSAPAKPVTTAKPAPLHVVKASSAKSHAISEARIAQAKAAAERAAKTAHVTRANYVVTTSHLNVRTGPGTKYRVAGTLAKGAAVVADTKTVNGFRQLANGHWVSAHYLKAVR